MVDEDSVPRVLHLHGGFNLGGKEARAVRLINIWGARLRHSIVSANHGAMSARGAIEAHVTCDFPLDAAPSLYGLPEPVRYWRWARYMRGFNLVLTYNWGAMDAVMAHRSFSPFLKLPPLIHHEDGFNEDEIERLKARRNHFRRWALGSTQALVVPSRRLEDIARSKWRQPDLRVKLIYNGIDVDAYALPPGADAIPGFRRNPERVVIGTIAGLRAVKNLPRLVRAAARIRDQVQLVIVGEGPERDTILAEARRYNLDALTLPGFLPDPWKYIGLFDIFALSSDSEQFPISLIEAMAAGLPAVTTDVGDVRSMLSDRNSRFIVDREDEDAYANALGVLIDNLDLRTGVGVANRIKAKAAYQERDMVAAYAKLYGMALHRADLKFSMHGEENLL